MLTHVVLLWTLLVCSGTYAGEPRLREFPVSKTMALAMDVDDTWMEAPAVLGNVAVISLKSKITGRLHLLLTPIPAGREQSNDGNVRAFLQSAANGIAPRSVERNLSLTSIQGPQAKGYQFHATDPASKPGEYHFMYQGAVAVGLLVVTFTVLYNDGAESEAKAALSAIQGLRVVDKSGVAL